MIPMNINKGFKTADTELEGINADAEKLEQAKPPSEEEDLALGQAIDILGKQFKKLAEHDEITTRVYTAIFYALQGLRFRGSRYNSV